LSSLRKDDERRKQGTKHELSHISFLS